MIKLFHKATTRSQIVVWLLEEIGIPYELEVTDTRSGFTKSPEFLAMNPMGKLPTLIDGDVYLSETGAICMYLSDRYGAGKVAPLIEDPARAEYLRWMFYVAGCVEPALVQTAFKFESNPRQTGWASADEVWSVISQAVSKSPYLLGDRFSTADIYLASRLRVGIRKGVLTGCPEFLSYVEHLDERAAWLRAAERGGYRLKKLSV